MSVGMYPSKTTPVRTNAESALVLHRPGTRRHTLGAEGDTGVEKSDVVLTVNVENIDLGEDVDILDREDDLTGGERRGVIEDGHVVDEHSKFSLLQCVEGILS